MIRAAREALERHEPPDDDADDDGRALAVVLAVEPLIAAQLQGAVEAIRKAPHARHCEAGASMWPGPCTCWKREWLDLPTDIGGQ